MVRPTLPPAPCQLMNRLSPEIHCTEKTYYLPSQLQRRGISYAKSKTDCQATNHCKLYSSKILDRSRDRKAHGLCPQAQPLRTSRLDHDPGPLSSWTASLRSPRSPRHQVELDHGRMHVRRAKNGTPSDILSEAMRCVPYASSASSHAAACVRLQTCQRRARYPSLAALSRP